MHIQVNYLAQLKQAAGRAEESVQLVGSLSLAEFAASLAEGRAALRAYLVPQGDGGAVAFVNDMQRGWSDPTPLVPGDRVTFLAPMAGG
jgi:molybdopterin converting factor small subunit